MYTANDNETPKMMSSATNVSIQVDSYTGGINHKG